MKVFKDEGLDITIEANLKSINFLDVEVDLATGLHRPYTKPNNTLLYIDTKSNHPKCVTKNTAPAVQKRLSELSSNEDIFNQAAPPYQAALDNAGHKHTLKYEETSTPQKRTNNRRQKTYFNPPFAMNVKTNVGADFLKCIDSCFPEGHPLRRILNRHTLKISYRTMPNMAQIISRHNSKTVRQQQPLAAAEVKTCSCPKAVRDSQACPLGGQCLKENTIYQATVTQVASGKVETYVGLASTTWKARFNVHTASMKNKPKPQAKSSNSTELSNHTWDLKDKGIDFKIDWKILDRAQTFNPSSKKCRLCLIEKYHLMFSKECATLNRRTEFYAACRHKTKKLISNG